MKKRPTLNTKKLDSLDENASETEQIEIENWIVDLVQNLKMLKFLGVLNEIWRSCRACYNPDYSLSDISSDEEHNDNKIKLCLQEDLDRRLRNIFRKFQDTEKKLA